MRPTYFLFFLIIPLILVAQKIPQKGSLGLQLLPAESNESGASFQVKAVGKGSTAALMGVKPGDLLLTINDQVINTGVDIQEAVKKFRVGEQAKVEILRNGERMSVKGAIQAAASFSDPKHNIELLEVPFRQGYVRAYLNYPKGEGPFPVIYYIQGYPCQSINNHPKSPTLQFTNHWVDLGYAVFRVEKPGVGEYVDCKECLEYLFKDEVEHFENSLGYLKRLEQVDSSRVYLFGHSLGGHVAPILAADQAVAGVMVYGTGIKPWADYIIDMARYTQSEFEDPEEVERKIPTLKTAVDKIYRQRLSFESLTKEEYQLMEDWHHLTADGKVFSRPIEFWWSLSDYDYFKEWKSVQAPVLALYGESDLHAIGPNDAQLISRVVNSVRPGQATFQYVEDTNHGLAKVESRAKEVEHMKNGTSGQVLYNAFHTKIIDQMNLWIQELEHESSSAILPYKKVSIPLERTRMSTMDVQVADLDDNGEPDLILATEFGPNQILFSQNGTWNIDPNRTLPQLKEYSAPFLGEDSEDVAIADFDQDGDLDLLFVSEDSEAHEYLLNDGEGRFIFAEAQIPKKGIANALLVFDYNHDQWPDVLLGIKGANELYVNKEGRFELITQTIWDENQDHTQDLCMADIDGDGDLDIIEAVELGGNNLYINEGGSFRMADNPFPSQAKVESRKVITKDVDADGDMDIFFCNVGWNPEHEPYNQLYINDGRGKFQTVEGMLPKDAATTLDAQFIDLNEDGILDIVSTNFINDKKCKTFEGVMESKGILTYRERLDWLPNLQYFGGTSVLHFNHNQTDYLYFGNYKSPDCLLMKQVIDH